MIVRSVTRILNFDLRVVDADDRPPQTGDQGIYLTRQLKDKPVEHRQSIHKHGQDLPEICDWNWRG